MTDSLFWRRCSTCKQPLGFNSTYWVCSVSTCNRRATEFAFCSVDCWDAHVPTLRHKESWAEERKGPASSATVEAPSPKRVLMQAPTPSKPSTGAQDLQARPPDEVLVVASKVKSYIRARSELNTSQGVMDALSEKVRALCDEAIRSARQHERKTVLDRDVT